MKEQLISFETAKLAKEKDFNILQHSYYFEDGEFKENSLKGTNGYYGEEYEFNLSEFNENWNDKWLTKKTGDRCFGCSKQKGYLETFSAPTQSLLQKWLREKHQIIVDVSLDFFNSYTKESIKYSPTFYTYSNNKKRFWIYTDYINSDECTKKMQEEMPIFQNYSTYEEALEIALFEALKLI